MNDEMKKQLLSDRRTGQERDGSKEVGGMGGCEDEYSGDWDRKGTGRRTGRRT